MSHRPSFKACGYCAGRVGLSGKSCEY